jgi:hypothetical protein
MHRNASMHLAENSINAHHPRSSKQKASTTSPSGIAQVSPLVRERPLRLTLRLTVQSCDGGCPPSPALLPCFHTSA